MVNLCFIVPRIIGVGDEDANALVKAAETCCTEDIYHFDDTERFFLVSCLALWCVIITLCFIAHCKIKIYVLAPYGVCMQVTEDISVSLILQAC